MRTKEGLLAERKEIRYRMGQYQPEMAGMQQKLKLMRWQEELDYNRLSKITEELEEIERQENGD